MGPESGAGDEDYVQRAMIHYQIDTGIPFKLRHCWEVLKDHPKWQEIAIPTFNTGFEGSSKRHKSTGFSSFNTESEEASINLNSNCWLTTIENNVQEIRHQGSVNEDALAKLMVTEMGAQEKEERLGVYIDQKKVGGMSVKLELEQQYMRFYLQSIRSLGRGPAKAK
ncbi:gamma-glutamyltranspeptidase 1 [Tanacetum coccineum]